MIVEVTGCGAHPIMTRFLTAAWNDMLRSALGKDLRQGNGEAGQDVTAIEGVAVTQRHRIRLGSKDHNRLSRRIDEPDEPRSCLEIHCDLGESIRLAIGGRENLNG